jgi:PII-like signaling protein
LGWACSTWASAWWRAWPRPWPAGRSGRRCEEGSAISDADCLKLTTYFGEHDRTGGRFLADALLDCYARHGVQASVLLRGIEGFGLAQRLKTQRLLTLSEDLPLVAVAVDARERIQRVLPEVVSFGGHGLVTLERARLLVGRVRGVRFPQGLAEETKLTVYLGRRERAAGGPAFLAVVEALRRHGVAGATVLVGVDGTAVGFRRRARFFGRNIGVPLMVSAVGTGEAIARALPELGVLLERPLVTLERVRVCKRDGRRLATPGRLPDADPSGLGVWQKLMVYAGEEARHGGHPLYVQLVRRLREAGASGATVLRGMWGYHGDHAPHGDRLLALRRRVPVVTVLVDTPSRMRQWFAIVDELTDETGLVTSEIVPAFRATGPGAQQGGLRLASWSAGELPAG